MLNDDQFKYASDNYFPLLSPKDITVWIKGTSIHWLLNEETETVHPLDLTLYTDENGVQRVMDTHTFKESFKEVPDYRIPKLNPSQTDPKNINAAKAMGYLK